MKDILPAEPVDGAGSPAPPASGAPRWRSRAAVAAATALLLAVAAGGYVAGTSRDGSVRLTAARNEAADTASQREAALEAEAEAERTDAAADLVAAEQAAEKAAAEQAAAEKAAAEKAAADQAAADQAAAAQAAKKAEEERAAAERAAQEAAAKLRGAAVTAPTSKPASSSAESTFDQAWALSKADDVIEDIGSVDERMQDGIMVGSALRLLSGSFGRVASAGVPPGVDPANYMARLSTLQEFAGRAADEMEYAPMEGAARYEVLRRETGVLFDQMNKALGSNLRLP